jgi:hypothetical protein
MKYSCFIVFYSWYMRNRMHSPTINYPDFVNSRHHICFYVNFVCDDFESNGNGHFLSERCVMLSVAIFKPKNFKVTVRLHLLKHSSYQSQLHHMRIMLILVKSLTKVLL